MGNSEGKIRERLEELGGGEWDLQPQDSTQKQRWRCFDGDMLGCQMPSTWLWWYQVSAWETVEQ
jgi:hypothetical protein